MTADEVRNWVGKYFLYVLGGLGGYVYLFSETILLPIERNEAFAAAETIIPVFLGQLTIMYRWFFSPNPDDTVGGMRIPSWLIKGPPIISVLLIIASIISMIVGNRTQANWSPDPEAFRRIVVFVVSIMNVTTIFVIGRYFGDAKKMQELQIEKPRSDQGTG